MTKDREQMQITEKGGQVMHTAIDQTSPCIISESIMQSCKEVKGMREGRVPKRSLTELFAKIEEWCREPVQNPFP